MAENIENTGTAIGWLEKIMQMARKYTFVEWIEGFLVITITFIMIMVFSHPRETMEFFQKAYAEQHTELMQRRQENSKEIQNAIDNFRYKTGADRVVITELHNGQNSINGIPFLKSTATFESFSDTVYPIATQYQNTNLSLFPFAQYIYDRGYWSGYVEDMKDIDKGLCYKMLSNDTEYYAACLIMGQERPIGFLFLSYATGSESEYTPEELEREMQRLSVQLGVLLELRNK